MDKASPLLQYSSELADLVLEWYEIKVQEKFYLKDIYNQLARSATSIGANIAESKFAQSNADYKSKMNIALKEANESKYWIERLVNNHSIDSDLESKLLYRLDNIIHILVSVCHK